MTIEEFTNGVNSTREDKGVDHPKHYNQEGRMECIREMEILFGQHEVDIFCKLNAYKYQYRAGMKEGEAKEKDLAKMNWYLNYAAGFRQY